MANMVPLINRNLFFDNPEIAGGKISHNGLFISFLKEYNGIMNIWLKTIDQLFEQAIPLTASKSPILSYFWSFDSSKILFINDTDGDENYNIFRINVEPSMDQLPVNVNITPLKEVTAQIYMVSEQNPDIIMVGLNNRDKAWHDLYQLNISTGGLTLIKENNDRLGGWEFDWDEKPRIAYRTDENGHSEILRLNDDQTFSLIYKTNLKEIASIVGWTEDNSKCYLITNKGEQDLVSLNLFDIQSETLEFIEADPEKKSDIADVYFHRKSKSLIYTSYTYDKTTRYWKNESWKSDFAVLEEHIGEKEYEIISKDRDAQRLLIGTTADTSVSEVYLFNRSDKSISFQYTTRPALKELEQYLCKMQSVSYPSSDEMVIPGYLTLPQKAIKPYPLMVLVHGGPKGPRDYWGYNGLVQFLANRGYAVLQPNFRASGGFGKHFLNAGDKEWGKKMQDDITWGVKYLIENEPIDPDRIGIMGGSYGGYATLAGLAFTPELYACGVDIVGPSNLFTLLESIPPYWEAGRKWLYEMVGDPDTEEGQKLLKEASPLFSADQIVKPLMIIQGANDPRVKQAESDQIVEAMTAKGKPVMYLCAKDEGHGFRKPLNQLAMYAAVEKFLAEHLKGRMQIETEKEVYETLQNLIVK